MIEELYTTCVSFDLNNEELIYIGLNDKSVVLVNYKDESEIMKYDGLPGIPKQVESNPLKIGFFYINFNHTINKDSIKYIAELHSAKNSIKSYIKIENQTIISFKNLISNKFTPKNWNGDALISTLDGSFYIYNTLNNIISYKSNSTHHDIIFCVAISSK